MSSKLLVFVAVLATMGTFTLGRHLGNAGAVRATDLALAEPTYADIGALGPAAHRMSEGASGPVEARRMSQVLAASGPVEARRMSEVLAASGPGASGPVGARRMTEVMGASGPGASGPGASGPAAQ